MELCFGCCILEYVFLSSLTSLLFFDEMKMGMRGVTSDIATFVTNIVNKCQAYTIKTIKAWEFKLLPPHPSCINITL
jgi:hypothetical protein